MQLELSSVARWKGDRVLVEVLGTPEKVGNFYVPASYAKTNGDDTKLWKGKVVAFGDKCDDEVSGWEEVKVGSIVWVRAIALHCPTFTDGDKRTVAVRQEDIYAVELN